MRLHYSLIFLLVNNFKVSKLNENINVAICQDYQLDRDESYQMNFNESSELYTNHTAQTEVNSWLYNVSIYEWYPSFPSACYSHSTKEVLLSEKKFELNTDGSLENARKHYWPNGSYCLAYGNSTQNFTSAIMCPPLLKPTGRTYLYTVMVTVSLVCLAIVILILTVVPVGTHKNVNRKIMLNYCVCLTAALFIVLIKWWSTLFHRDFYFCALIDVAIHYFTLTLLTWSNVMCLHIWLTFRSFHASLMAESDHGERAFLWYIIYAYSFPALIVLVGVILEYAPGIPGHIKHDIGAITCFFQIKNTPFMMFVFSPAFFLLIINIFLFTRTSIFLYRQRNVPMSASQNHNKITFVLFLRLFILMGVSWFGEIWSWPLQTYLDGIIPEQVFYVTDCINCLQGLFILIIYITSNNFQRSNFKETLQDFLCTCCSKEDAGEIKRRRQEYQRRSSSTIKTPSVRLTKWVAIDSTAELKELT